MWPEIIFSHLPAGKHEKFSNFMRQPVPVTLLPLDISSVLARVTKSMMRPVSGTLANSAYCPSTTSGTLSGYRSWVHAVFLSVFSHRRRHQTNMGFWLSPQFYDHFKRTSKKCKIYSYNLSKWRILKNHRMCIAGVKQFCQSYYSWLTLSFHMLWKFYMFLILKSFSE